MSRTNRNVVERWYITGTLELTSPTSLSNGDDDPLVDLPIVVDPLKGVALLTGASLAGALRAYVAEFDPTYATVLFGGVRGDPDGTQSALIVEDALGDKPVPELRDGVSIDPATRTAKERERYDRQLLPAGIKFGLGFELIVTTRDDPAQLAAALATALRGLEQGDIRLGGRKRRGYGQCQAISWQAWRYDLRTAEGMCGWLAHGRDGWPGYQGPQYAWPREENDTGILDWSALPDVSQVSRQNPPLTLAAAFDIDGAVLIRHGFETESGPDATHLRSRRGDDVVPVMSGTSLAGVIRAQALRIARTMAAPGGEAGQQRAEALVRGMFGYMQRPDELPPSSDGRRNRRDLMKQASRVTVDESVIEGQQDLVQTRVKIDRFTGGAFESALFAEQPVFGGGFTLNLALRQPEPAEIGLLLLVLKDLWTGFLPVGGSSSVGRGRLKGRAAQIEYGSNKWTLVADGAEKVTLSPDGAAEALNKYVTAFTQYVTGGRDGGQ